MNATMNATMNGKPLGCAMADRNIEAMPAGALRDVDIACKGWLVKRGLAAATAAEGRAAYKRTTQAMGGPWPRKNRSEGEAATA
jgi:hypothetical protein